MRKKLIIYILALIALIAGYIAITKLPEKKDEEKTYEYNLLEGFEINTVEVENSYGKYVLTYDDADWKMDGAKVSREYITLLSGISSNLKLQSDDLKAFGLENPVSRVTLTGKDGSVKTLLIGDLVADKTGRYVLSENIYVVANEYISWLIESKDIFKNRNLFSETSPKKVEFNGICFEILNDDWQMTRPYQHRVRGEEFKKEVLESLNFVAVDFTDKSKSECGLDTPKGYISVWDSEDEKTTIYFGDKSDGLIYAMREGEDEICRINTPGFLEKKPIFFLNKLCYVKNIDEIDSIQVNGTLFEISEGEYKKDGKRIEKTDFIEFYKQLMGMTLIDEAKSPSRDKLILSMKVNFKDGKNDIVEVYEYKDRYGAVFINGVCAFYILRESAEKIVSHADEL